MISKELLSEVLGAEVEFAPTCLELANGSKCIEWKKVTKAESHTAVGFQGINIYELAHKCKEWALKYGYQLHSAMRNGNLPIGMLTYEQDVLRHYFKADTEPEVIFKACEWLLEKTKGLK